MGENNTPTALKGCGVKTYTFISLYLGKYILWWTIMQFIAQEPASKHYSLHYKNNFFLQCPMVYCIQRSTFSVEEVEVWPFDSLRSTNFICLSHNSKQYATQKVHISSLSFFSFFRCESSWKWSEGN